MSLSQRVVQKRYRALPRVGGGFGTIPGSVIRVLECVAGAGINFEINAAVQALHGLFERLDVRGCDAFIIRAKIPQNPRADLLDVIGIGGERTVIHHDGAEMRLVDREL